MFKSGSSEVSNYPFSNFFSIKKVIFIFLIASLTFLSIFIFIYIENDTLKGSILSLDQRIGRVSDARLKDRSSLASLENQVRLIEESNLTLIGATQMLEKRLLEPSEKIINLEDEFKLYEMSSEIPGLVWSLYELEYYLKVADFYLLTLGEVDRAIDALNIATIKYEEISTDIFQYDGQIILDEINNAINTISSAPFTDYKVLDTNLIFLSSKVPELISIHSYIIDENINLSNSDNDSGYIPAGLDFLKQALLRMISIEKTDELYRSPISIADIETIKVRLLTEISLARVALSLNKYIKLNQSLVIVESLIEQNFKVDDSQLTNTLEYIKIFSDRPTNVQKPNINSIIQLISIARKELMK
tara:strand:+ start:111436 stop:112515 length:1080 start_codon:yes stop_codon:yes gene_type:complete